MAAPLQFSFYKGELMNQQNSNQEKTKKPSTVETNRTTQAPSENPQKINRDDPNEPIRDVESNK
jgi:hypothetical protein